MEKKEGKNLTTNDATQKISEGPLDQKTKAKISTLFRLAYIFLVIAIIFLVIAVIKLTHN